MFRGSFIASVCGLISVAASLGGQSPETQTPTFRAETRAIEVDAYVMDPSGAFVRGLTRDDFEILEDGQPQEISAFTLVDVPIDAPLPAGEKPARDKRPAPAVDPDVTTNVTEGRVYVMLLDSPGLQVDEFRYVTLESMFVYSRRVASQFVDEALGPHDLMAVIHVQDSRSDAQSFTSNKRLLRESIDRLKPDMNNPSSYCDFTKIRNSYEMIEMVSERLGALTGRRKAILWVNGRVPFDHSDECGEAGASLAFMHRDAIRAATRNNVAIYPIDSVGLTADPTDSRRQMSLRRLQAQGALRAIAEDTGGDAILNTNNFSGGFERIVRQHSTYYLLGYRPTQEHRDGKFHSITVRVRRPGLSVRARTGYRAPEPGEPPDAQILSGVSEAAREALARALPSSGLGLQMFLTPFKGTGPDASVLVGAEVRGLLSGNVAEPRMEVSFLAIDSQGKTRATPQATKVSFASATRGVVGGSVQYLDRVTLPPGRHEVRLAIEQPGGNTGAIVAHVEIPDFARRPLTMSGIALLASGDVPAPLLVGDRRLNGTPMTEVTTRRRFTRREVVAALVEVYSQPRTKVEEVGMAVTIATARAPGTAVRSVIAARISAEPGRIAYRVRLPLSELQSDDYVLTFDAKGARSTVKRQVPFTVVDE